MKHDTWNAANFTFGNNIYTSITTMISVFVSPTDFLPHVEHVSVEKVSL